MGAIYNIIKLPQAPAGLGFSVKPWLKQGEEISLTHQQAKSVE